MHAVLRNSLGYAEKQGIIPSNPTKRVDKPVMAKREMAFFSDDQVRRLLSAAAGKTVEVLLQLAITTGMRQGELLGLKWSDVDWVAATIRVQRQLQRIPTLGLVFAQPKSKSSIRTVQLGAFTLKKLMGHKDQQDMQFRLGENKENLIFPSSIGTPKEPRILLAEFKALQNKAGLPNIRFHDLRHTAASLMLMSGMELMRISRQLGHSKPSITLDVYGHLIPGLENEAAQRLDELVTPTIAAQLQQKSQKVGFDG
jgi:integrase